MPWETVGWSSGASWESNWQNPFPIWQPISVAAPPILATIPQFPSITADSASATSFAHGTGVEQASGTVSIPEGETSFIPEILTEGIWEEGWVLPTYTAPFVQTNEEAMAESWDGWSDVFDWGSGVIQDWLNPATTPIYNFTQPTGAGTPAAPDYSAVTAGAAGGHPPGMYIDRHGHLVHRRRRRRRLLTESDFNDLMRIATLPNKQNVTVALAKAIGRR